MPVEYKQFNPSQDVTTTKTLLHEVIPITGSILSGTYGTFPNEGNIKNYSHGMFQSVYDYPYLSSSANHIIDITVGYDEDSGLSGSGTQNAKKINLYNQYAQVLLGYTGSEADSVRKFERDTTLDQTGSMKEVIFLSLSRLITKDQIKKGSFQLSIGTGSSFSDPFAGGTLTLTDAQATDTGGTNPAQGGDYGVLYTSSVGINANSGFGNIFYQAGIVVLTASVFGASSEMDSSARTIDDLLTGSAISASCDAIRHRISNLTFNNTTEINSKIYFCRAPFNRFNYSANPTYTSGSKIVTKNVAADTPIAYITTIGLYSSSGELLATAKLSEPLRKDPTNELTLRVRLDY
jgi:hypothetical protein